MQNKTGRIESIQVLEGVLKEGTADQYRKSMPSMKGMWSEIEPQEAEMLKKMNRAQRREWLAKQRKNGRVFKEVEIK